MFGFPPQVSSIRSLLATSAVVIGCHVALAASPKSESTTATATSPDRMEFSVDVMSVLSKAGCNLGTCHGNLNGKGGLKLSLRGQNPMDDYRALVMQARGRRVSLTAPSQSLILHKATGRIPHRGGVRFHDDSWAYQTLQQWLAEGGAPPNEQAPTVTRLDVDPPRAIVEGPVDRLSVSVTAHFSDGTTREVSDIACYELSNLNATVTDHGEVIRKKYGETTLIVRYLQQQIPVPIAFIRGRPDFQWNEPPEVNFVDRHVFAKLQQLKINPSPLCDDSTFVRRAYLDLLGRIPNADEARQFVSDPSQTKRAELIDQLLTRPEFADYWALKWADILRTEEKVLDVEGVEAFHAWIRDGIAQGKPLDQFVRELVTGTGSTFKRPAANFYRANRDAVTRGETTARLFLGTRLQCAKCHNHPFDRWTQNDYYQWASVFSQLDYKLEEDQKRRDKLDKNEFPGDQVVLIAKQDEVVNPTTGSVAPPKFLGGPKLSEKQTAQRLNAVARWMTAPDNELFARSQTNFVWYHLMGRGLVDPIDDFRLTNPASNPALMDDLAEQFAVQGFDLRWLVRTIMNSRTYQLAAEPNVTNRDDRTSYSHTLTRRLPAEVLLDMQSDVLDVPAEFVGYEEGIRAVQIPGVRRKRLRDARPLPGDRFLKTFGKPERILACDCERSNETTLKQVFLLIGDGLSRRLHDQDNRLHRLAASDQSNSEVVEELYWTALSRPPAKKERTAAVELIKSSSGDRLVALQDIAWALMNAKEFLFRK